jgi:hypothetical protein
MNHLTVYIGDDSPSFRVFVANLDKSAQYKVGHDFSPVTKVYLSTVQFGPKHLMELLVAAKEIIYCPPVNWSNKDVKYHTIGWIEYINTVRPIQTLRAGQYGLGPILYTPSAFNKPTFLNPVQGRQTDGPQVWMVGCSFTNGHGLADRNLRFGQLFADTLGLPVSFLTMNGASNQWIADQILKADIRENDIVFCGLTGVARSTIYTEEKPWPITINMLDKQQPYYRSLIVNNNKIAPMRRMITEEFLLSDHSFFESINHIEQIKNYLQMINVKHLIGYFADLDFPYLDHMGRMMHYIVSQDTPNMFVIRPEYPWVDIITRSPEDTNNDNTPVHHPGPNQHQVYANDLLAIYNKIYQ